MSSEIRDYTREEMLELTPSRYLAGGYLDINGKPLWGLETTFATAVATQFLDAELSPQELSFTYEALKQTLELHAGAPAARLRAATDEALDVVRGMIRQPNNLRLTKWIHECIAAVKSASDHEAFLVHFMAVLRQYSVVVALRSR